MHWHSAFLTIESESVPFKPNMSKIAAMLNISRNNIADYLLYIEEAGMIAQLRSETSGVRALGKVDKIYLENTNLMHQLSRENQNLGPAVAVQFDVLIFLREKFSKSVCLRSCI